MGAARVADLPSGTVTFLFTDIEGSTKLLRRLGDAYAGLLEAHRALLRDAFTETSGHLVDSIGDECFATFARARDAVTAALVAQRAVAAHEWPDGSEVRVRIGIHTGEAMLTPDGYVGLSLHLTARICAAGHGGQVLVSDASRQVVADDLLPGAGLRDLGQHRLKDLAGPQRLFQLTHPDLPDRFPTLRSLDTVPHNLPVQLTSFVGREEEMAEVVQLLGTSRLLTLTGSGGCGKTRLAQQVAAEVVDDHPDGVWLVELAPLAESHLVPAAVASTMGVREEPGRSLDETLSDALREKQLLLVIDNCEHLVEASAELVAVLLRSCPRSQVLATSQQPLDVAGEVIWRVPSLPLPEPGTRPSLDALSGYAAIRLFLERAVLSRPGFVLTDENAPAVVQICRRLDGIPLAIELAAVRVNVLTPQQIADRLDDQFRLLTGGRSTVPRQQTLRAAVDWSHNLLAEADQVLLRRLSVFAGGWTLDAAEAVCTGAVRADPVRPDTTDGNELSDDVGEEDAFDGPAFDGLVIEEPDVLDLLARLAAKSCVLVDEHAGASRYRLLNTIRQYARTKLEEAGETARFRSRHLEWCAQLVTAAEVELEGPHQVEWLRRLQAEHDNLRAALEWAGSHPAGGDLLLTLAASPWRFWLVRGHWTEGRAWLARGLAVNEGWRSSVRAKALNAAGDLAMEQADHAAAEPLLEESLSIWRELGDRRGIAKALSSLGNLARYRFDYDRARSLLGEALSIRREEGDERGVAVSLRNLGLVAALERDPEQARPLYEEGLAIARRVGDKQVVATLTHALATVSFTDGDRKEARRLAEEGLALSRELGDLQSTATHLTILSGVTEVDGDDDLATDMLDEALGIWRNLGSKDALAWSRTNLGDMALAAGDLARARSHYEAALAAWRSLGDRGAITRLLNLVGWVACMSGDLASARRWLEDAVDAAREQGERSQLAATLHSLGEVRRLEGDLDAAVALFDESLSLARDSGSKKVVWAPIYSIGAVARARGDLDAAEQALREALSLCPQLGGRAHTSDCLEELAAVASGRGDALRAARLLGAADALRRAAGVDLPPVRRPVHEATAAAARSALGDEAFAAAWDAGAALSFRQLLGEALAAR